MKKKLIISLIAVVLILALSVGVFAACNKKKNNDNNGNVSFEVNDLRVNFDPIVNAATSDDAATSVVANMNYDLVDPDDFSDDAAEFAKYDAALGDFYDALTAAKALDDVDAKHAGMAIAEAKLLESGTFLPVKSHGGQYAINKTVPYSVSPCLWGNDSSRLYTAIVADKNLTLADRNALKALYKEKKGTGTYIASAKRYLYDHGYGFKTVWNAGYSADPETWDITATMRSSDSEVIVNTFDGLVGYSPIA
ncbi:MAG: hypothetical protein J5815_02460, partial [Clostridia bacterium]|nr:hypothetical protein [Clostridia bacterium]